MYKYLLLLLISCNILVSQHNYKREIRGEKHDRLQINDSIFTSNLYVTPKYYKPDTTQPVWDTIVRQWADSGNFFAATRNKYKLYVRKNILNDSVFIFSYKGKQVVLEPLLILYNNDIQSGYVKPEWQYTIRASAGYLIDSSTIRFDSCFGPGIHIEVSCANEGIQINKVFDSGVIQLPVGATYLDIVFKIKTASTTKFKKPDGKYWDKIKTDKNIDYIDMDDVPDYRFSKSKSRYSNLPSSFSPNTSYLLSSSGNTKLLTKRISNITNGYSLTTDYDLHPVASGKWSNSVTSYADAEISTVKTNLRVDNEVTVIGSGDAGLGIEVGLILFETSELGTVTSYNSASISTPAITKDSRYTFKNFKMYYVKATGSNISTHDRSKTYAYGIVTDGSGNTGADNADVLSSPSFTSYSSTICDNLNKGSNSYVGVWPEYAYASTNYTGTGYCIRYVSCNSGSGANPNLVAYNGYYCIYANISSATLAVTYSTGSTYTISGTITGASNVTVNLTGSSTATTTTDASGNYSFSSLSSGTYTVTPTKTYHFFNPVSQTFASISDNQTQNFTANPLKSNYIINMKTP